jgi:hypothetical protein
MSRILELLETGDKTTQEMLELSEIPKSTLYRSISTLVDEGTISKVGDKYRIAKHPPSPREIADDMEIIFQQKMMDKSYRRRDIYSKADQVIDWYMEFQLKGKIDDYSFDKLLDNIHKGWNYFMSKHHLDYEKK